MHTWQDVGHSLAICIVAAVCGCGCVLPVVHSILTCPPDAAVVELLIIATWWLQLWGPPRCTSCWCRCSCAQVAAPAIAAGAGPHTRSFTVSPPNHMHLPTPSPASILPANTRSTHCCIPWGICHPAPLPSLAQPTGPPISKVSLQPGDLKSSPVVATPVTPTPSSIVLQVGCPVAAPTLTKHTPWRGAAWAATAGGRRWPGGFWLGRCRAHSAGAL